MAAFPDVDEVVSAKISSIGEFGVFVTLPDYGGREAMILMSEISRRPLNRQLIEQRLKVGKVVRAVVLRVDRDKGYIDLSKRRV